MEYYEYLQLSAIHSTLMLNSALELINMVMHAIRPCSHGADPQWHTFPEMSYGTNKMAPEASQLDGNTSVSVSLRKGGQFGCWQWATAPAGWKYINHYRAEKNGGRKERLLCRSWKLTALSRNLNVNLKAIQTNIHTLVDLHWLS